MNILFCIWFGVYALNFFFGFGFAKLILAVVAGVIAIFCLVAALKKP